MYQDPSQAGGNRPMDESAASGQSGYRSIWNQQSSPRAGGYSAVQPAAGYQSGFGQQNPQAAPQAQQNGFGWQQPAQQPYGEVGARPQGGSAYPQQGTGYAQQPAWPGAQSDQGQQAGQGAWPQWGAPAPGWQQDPGFQQMPPQNWQEAQMYNGPTPNPHRGIDWRLVFIIVSCGVMPLLFIVTMLLSGQIRTALTVALAAGSIATLLWMWLSQPFEKPTHIMITVLYALALAVAVITAVPRADTAAAPERGPEPTPAAPPTLQVNEPQPEAELPAAEEVEVRETEADASVQRMRDFLDHWRDNDLDYMVNLCAPSWIRSLSRTVDAKSSLFGLLQNRTLIDYEIVSVSGTENDMSRTVTIQATIDKRTQTADSIKQYQISAVVTRENDTWYVDPRSLQSYEPTPTPTSTSAKLTQPPTPAPGADSTVLYYNPDGGKFYHLNPECPTIGQKYRPLTHTFRFSEINEGAFKDLLPCGSCSAPLRPN